MNEGQNDSKEYLFSDRLKTRMEELGLKDYEIWDVKRGGIDIDHRTFNGYKTGRNTPPADVVFNLAQRLNCTAGYLLGLEDFPTPAATDICKWTGLTNKAVETLHALYENNSGDNRGFSILINLFEYMVNQYKMYVQTKATLEKAGIENDSAEYGVHNFTNDLLNHINDAARSLLISRKAPPKQKEIYDKACNAELHLNKNGFIVLPSELAYQYHLMAATEEFTGMAKSFVHEKLNDKDYANRLLDSTGLGVLKQYLSDDYITRERMNEDGNAGDDA